MEQINKKTIQKHRQWLIDFYDNARNILKGNEDSFVIGLGNDKKLHITGDTRKISQNQLNKMSRVVDFDCSHIGVAAINDYGDILTAGTAFSVNGVSDLEVKNASSATKVAKSEFATFAVYSDNSVEHFGPFKSYFFSEQIDNKIVNAYSIKGTDIVMLANGYVTSTEGYQGDFDFLSFFNIKKLETDNALDILETQVYGLKKDGTVVVTSNAILSNKRWIDCPQVMKWSDISNIVASKNCLVGIRNNGKLMIAHKYEKQYENTINAVRYWSNVAIISVSSEEPGCFVCAGVTTYGKGLAEGFAQDIISIVRSWENLINIFVISDVCVIGVKANGKVVQAGKYGFKSIVGRDRNIYSTSGWKLKSLNKELYMLAIEMMFEDDNVVPINIFEIISLYGKSNILKEMCNLKANGTSNIDKIKLSEMTVELINESRQNNDYEMLAYLYNMTNRIKKYNSGHGNEIIVKAIKPYIDEYNSLIKQRDNYTNKILELKDEVKKSFIFSFKKKNKLTSEIIAIKFKRYDLERDIFKKFSKVFAVGKAEQPLFYQGKAYFSAR